MKLLPCAFWAGSLLCYLKPVSQRSRITDTHNCFQKLNFLETVQYLKNGFQEEGQKSVAGSWRKIETDTCNGVWNRSAEMDTWILFCSWYCWNITTANYMVLGLNLTHEDFNKSIRPLFLWLLLIHSLAVHEFRVSELLAVCAAVPASAVAGPAVGAVHFWRCGGALQPLLLQVRRVLPAAHAGGGVWQQPRGAAGRCLRSGSDCAVRRGQLPARLPRYCGRGTNGNGAPSGVQGNRLPLLPVS